MKLTKKLVGSIVMLVLSLAFCAWAVFAWFAQNSSVSATGMQVRVEVENVYMKISVYSLTLGTDGYTQGDCIYYVDSNGKSMEVTQTPAMPDYATSTTGSAVLITIEMQNGTSEELQLYLTTNGTAITSDQQLEPKTLLTKPSEGQTAFTTQLSNAVSLYNTEQTTSPYTKGSTVYRYLTPVVSDVSTTAPQKDTLTLNGGEKVTLPAAENGTSQTVTLNYILDYDRALIDYLSALALLYGGAVNSTYTFASDLVFVLGSGAGSSSGATTNYTVTLDPNGGTLNGSASAQNVTGESIDLSGYTPTHSNSSYTFNGWNTEADGTGTAYEANAVITQTITLYAQWTAQQYTVTYHDYNGSTSSTSVDAGSDVTLTAPTERDGYIFNGWSTTSGGTVVYEVGDKITVNSNIDLYENWTAVETQTTTMDYDMFIAIAGGTGNTHKLTSAVTVGKFTASADTYFEDGRVNNQGNDISFKVSGISNSVSFDLRGATASGCTLSLVDSNGNTLRTWDNVANSTTVSDLSYSSLPVGEYILRNATGSIGRIYNLTITENFAPGTQPSRYNVTFMNGTTTVATAENIASGYSVPAPTLADTTEQTFNGWNTAENGGGTAYAAGATVTVNGSAITLYAQWESTQTSTGYTLTLNAGSGTFSSNSSSTLALTGQTTVTLASLEQPTPPTNYTFSGWSYDGSTVITDATITLTENTQLYAVYTTSGTGETGSSTYSISFSSKEISKTAGITTTDTGSVEDASNNRLKFDAGSDSYAITIPEITSATTITVTIRGVSNGTSDFKVANGTATESKSFSKTESTYTITFSNTTTNTITLSRTSGSTLSIYEVTITVG